MKEVMGVEGVKGVKLQSQGFSSPCPVWRSVQFTGDGHSEGAAIGVENGALGDGVAGFPVGQVVERGYLKLVDLPFENAVNFCHDNKVHHLAAGSLRASTRIEIRAWLVLVPSGRIRMQTHSGGGGGGGGGGDIQLQSSAWSQHPPRLVRSNAHRGMRIFVRAVGRREAAIGQRLDCSLVPLSVARCDYGRLGADGHAPVVVLGDMRPVQRDSRPRLLARESLRTSTRTDIRA